MDWLILGAGVLAGIAIGFVGGTAYGIRAERDRLIRIAWKRLREENGNRAV